MFRATLPGWRPRNIAGLLVLTLCAGCTLTPHEVETAPAVNNLAVVFDIDGNLTTTVHAIRSTREGAVGAVDAYASAGIDPGRVFALRREGAKACEPGAWTACFGSWPEQMQRVEDLIAWGSHGVGPSQP